MSVSLPFLAPSSQRPGRHSPSLQDPLAQSSSEPPAFPSAHSWSTVSPSTVRVQAAPQSMSDSPPFCTESSQAGSLHVFVSGSQRALKQSASDEHCLPGEHLGHSSPPQSMSDSRPFRMSSVHCWVVHTSDTQSSPSQSESSEHARPTAHGPQVPPPQSMSVSAPFRTPSVQAGAAQRPPMHTRLTQSYWKLQRCPSPQSEQAGPPQSSSVSLPFSVSSLQRGG